MEDQQAQPTGWAQTVARDFLAPPYDRALRPAVTLVRQGDGWGCVIASLAMVTGQTYAEVKCDLHPAAYLPREGSSGGLPFSDALAYLAERGYASILRYRHCHVAAADREVWPPKPFADVHLCEVLASCSHCVVMLADGSVLDPWRGHVPSLAAYDRVIGVAGVWRVRDRLPDALLSPESPGRARPPICMCAATWEEANPMQDA